MLVRDRPIKPPPPNFCHTFVTRGGWRAIERVYGSRTDVLRNWVHTCGGNAVLTGMYDAYRKGELGMAAKASEMDRVRGTSRIS